MNTSIHFRSLLTCLLIFCALLSTTMATALSPWCTTISAPVVWHPLEMHEGLAAVVVKDLTPGQEYRLEIIGDSRECMEWFNLKNGSQIEKDPANGSTFIAEGESFKLMWDQICDGQLILNITPIEPSVELNTTVASETRLSDGNDSIGDLAPGFLNSSEEITLTTLGSITFQEYTTNYDPDRNYGLKSQPVLALSCQRNK